MIQILPKHNTQQQIVTTTATTATITAASSGIRNLLHPFNLLPASKFLSITLAVVELFDMLTLDKLTIPLILFSLCYNQVDGKKSNATSADKLSGDFSAFITAMIVIVSLLAVLAFLRFFVCSYYANDRTYAAFKCCSHHLFNANQYVRSRRVYFETAKVKEEGYDVETAQTDKLTQPNKPTKPVFELDYNEEDLSDWPPKPHTPSPYKLTPKSKNSNSIATFSPLHESHDNVTSPHQTVISPRQKDSPVNSPRYSHSQTSTLPRGHQTSNNTPRCTPQHSPRAAAHSNQFHSPLTEPMITSPLSSPRKSSQHNPQYDGKNTPRSKCYQESAHSPRLKSPPPSARGNNSPTKLSPRH